MENCCLTFPVPDVVGLDAQRAKEILLRNGFFIKNESITQTAKRGQPEGGLRVVRQRVNGQEIDLVYAYEKWVCV